MIIELPEMFYKADGKKYVRVKNGILEIHGYWDFEKLMVQLAYEMKGKCQCYYCRKSVDPKKITIDHLFPSDFGGMSITNNLEPACQKCNSSKSNMNQYEYGVWRTIRDEEAQKNFYHSVVAKKKKRKFNAKVKKGFDLPKSWVEYRRLDSIQKISKVSNTNSNKFKRMLTFARRYNKLPRTIVVSRNGKLLDGATAYEVAKKLRFVEVPVTVLENVVIYRA